MLIKCFKYSNIIFQISESSRLIARLLYILIASFINLSTIRVFKYLQGSRFNSVSDKPEASYRVIFVPSSIVDVIFFGESPLSLYPVLKNREPSTGLSRSARISIARRIKLTKIDETRKVVRRVSFEKKKKRKKCREYSESCSRRNSSVR